jgi:hypothetical protein
MINEVILTLTDNNGNASTIDLYENEKVHLNYKFTDLTNFSSIGNYSQEFRIPASKNNVDFFGAIFNVNFNGWFDFRKKVDASLTVNTIPIATGHIQVKKLYWQTGKLFEFEVVFFGEIPNLSRLLNEKKLRDIESIAAGDLDYDFIYANVITPPNDHTILTLCDKWNLTESNQQGQPIFWEYNLTDPGNTAQPLRVGHLTPAVRAYYLFDQILKDAGIQWTSDNLSSCLENVYIPFINGQYLNSSVGLNDNASKLALANNIYGLSFGFSSNLYNLYSDFTEYQDTGNNWSSGIFTVPFNGNYTFNIAINGRVNTLDGYDYQGLYYTRIVVYVNDIYTYSYELNQGGYIFHLNTNQTYSFNTGDEVKFYFQLVPQQGNLPFYAPIWDVDLFGNTHIDSFGTGLELLSIGTPLVGGTCVMKLNAPDMKQIDFLTSIQKMFNLSFIPDKTLPNTLRIEPMSEFIGSGNTLDWSDKLDLSKDIMYYPTTDLQKANFTFTYADDNDYFNSLYKDNGHLYGTYKVTENDFEIINEFATGEEKVELTFAPTPCSNVETSNVIVPKFVNSEGNFVQPKPRILYYAADSLVRLWNEVTNGLQNTLVPCLNNFSSVNATVSDKDLNFAPEIALHPIIAPPYNNLYNRWWRNYYRELYDGQARIMEGMFALTLNDIFTFQFSDRIWIVDSWWRILEITGYVVGEQEMTSVKLIRLLDIDNGCDLKPVSANLDQTLNWETPNGDPATVTEDCCRRFGYNWNSAKNNCFSQPNIGTRSFITAQAPTLAPTDFGAPVRFNASVSQPIKTLTTDYVVTNFDRVLIGDESAGDIIVYLPSATTIIGREIIIQNKTGTNKIIITPYTGETINGSISLWLTTARQTVTLISDGTDFTTTTAK